MPKLNEEAPQALAVVLWVLVPVWEAPQVSEAVRWDRALVMVGRG
jgi:hypothetical protein